MERLSYESLDQYKSGKTTILASLAWLSFFVIMISSWNIYQGEELLLSNIESSSMEFNPILIGSWYLIAIDIMEVIIAVFFTAMVIFYSISTYKRKFKAIGYAFSVVLVLSIILYASFGIMMALDVLLLPPGDQWIGKVMVGSTIVDEIPAGTACVIRIVLLISSTSLNVIVAFIRHETRGIDKSFDSSKKIMDEKFEVEKKLPCAELDGNLVCDIED